MVQRVAAVCGKPQNNHTRSGKLSKRTRRGSTAHLICGDSIESMKTIPDGTVDMVCVDPPYGVTQCAWDSPIPLQPMWDQVRRVTKPNAAIVMTSMQPFTTALISSNMGIFRYCWVWGKNLKSGNLNAKRRPMTGHEDIAVFYRKQPTYNPIKRMRAEGQTSPRKSYSKTIIYGAQSPEYENLENHLITPDTLLTGIKGVHNSQGKVHPTQKPVELMEYLIRTYTDSGDTVMDFAMGSGTCGVAALNLGRRFVGIELDNSYFDIAKDRIHNRRSN